MADKPTTEETKTDPVNRVIAEIRRFWENLPKRAKILMVGVVIFVVAAGAALLTLDQTEEKALFSGLNTEDMAAVAQSLKDTNVKYRISADGGTILVPASQVHDLRLQLAAEGIPVGGGVGFELFDEQRFGMTAFEERIALRRALEGELSRTIARIDSVRNAKVHLVMPKRSVLGSKSTPSQGSVIIELEKGRELSKQGISSITHLISSGVEGLNPDKISIVDTRGRLLSSKGGNGLDSNELEYQQNYEQTIELKIREMLDQTLGTNTSVVRVAANFDFSKRESTAENYDPDRSVIRSEQRETEQVGSPTSGAGGIPGTRSNLPGGTPASSLSGASSKKREMETRNYEVDKTISRTIGPAALLAKLSVTVLVDDTRQKAQKPVVEEGKEEDAKEKTEKQEETVTPRTAEELKMIELAVKGAIGFDDTRGDRVVVQSMTFAPVETLDEPAAGPAWWKEWLPLAVGGIVGLMLVLAVLSLRKKKVSLEPAVTVESLALPRPVEELEALMEGPRADTLALAQSTEPEMASATALMGDVRHVFMEESENASKVLKSWLGDARKAEELERQQSAEFQHSEEAAG